MENTALPIAAIGLICGAVGMIFRHRTPRVALFLMGLAALSLGIWMVTSTLELDAIGKAHMISRSYKLFNQSDAPSDGRISFWFHLVLGIFILLVGLVTVILPFTKRARHIRFRK
jgi:hypothetical protein